MLSIEHEVTSGIVISWRQHIGARSNRDLARPGWFRMQRGLVDSLMTSFKEDPEGKVFCVENDCKCWIRALTMAGTLPECITFLF